MSRFFNSVALVAFFSSLNTIPAQDKVKPADESLAKAKSLVADKLKELKAPEVGVEPVADKLVRDLFPNHVAVVVGFPQWPVAVAPPAPLKSRNLFLVSKDGKLEHVTAAGRLEGFFKTHVPATAKHANVVKAWLRLTQEFVQDGFFKFTISDKMDEILGSSVTVVSGVANVVPEQGNKGQIKASVRFDRDNKVASIQEEIKVVRGIRPRCQARLLVHPDAVIRAMAEDDLRVMGRAAQQYLFAQRAQASPELRAAIDRLWQQIVGEEQGPPAAETGKDPVEYKGKNLKVLIEELQAKDAKVAAHAALVIGKLGPKAKDATGALIHALQSSDSTLSLNAGLALQEIGEPALTALIQAVRAMSADSATASGKTLTQWRKVLVGSDVNQAIEATKALAQLGPKAKASVPDLVQVLRHEHPAVRQYACRALAHIGPEAKEAVPHLIRLIEDDAANRGDAAEALGGIGPAAKSALPRLEGFKSDRVIGAIVNRAIERISNVKAK